MTFLYLNRGSVLKEPSIKFQVPLLHLDKFQNLFCNRAVSQISSPLVDKIKNVVGHQTDDVQWRPKNGNVCQESRKKLSTFCDDVAVGESESTQSRKDDVSDVGSESIFFVWFQNFCFKPIWKRISQSDDVVQSVSRRIEGPVKLNFNLVKFRKNFSVTFQNRKNYEFRFALQPTYNNTTDHTQFYNELKNLNKQGNIYKKFLIK